MEVVPLLFQHLFSFLFGGACNVLKFARKHFLFSSPPSSAILRSQPRIECMNGIHLAKKIDNSQSKGRLENRLMLVYCTKGMHYNGPKSSSKIDWTGGLARVAISWSDAKTVSPRQTDLRLLQSLQVWDV